jgi:hypothetical protein
MHLSHGEAFNRSWVAGRNEDVPRSRRQFQRFDCEIESITVFEGARLQSDGPWERTDFARFVCDPHGVWTLFSAGRPGQFHRHRRVRPTRELHRLATEVDLDLGSRFEAWIRVDDGFD